MEKMNDLRDLLKHELEDLQSAEDQILEALPKMIDKANNPDLKKALSEHLKVTEQHKSRLEKIMKNMGGSEETNGKKKGILGGIFSGGKHVCKGMKGIIEEGEKIMGTDISPEARDAAIIASAQKVEHYEICGYGTARTFAREIGMEQVARQLEQTLNEEYAADDLLTNLAVIEVNEEAETPDGGSVTASSTSRSAGRVKEKSNREMEMEPVNASRSRSSSREESSASKSNTQNSKQPKTSGSPRNENGRSSSSSKKTVTNERGSKSSGRGNGRSSSSGGRGNTSKGNSRGGR
jgi:ferritin-like metal-binding protein YciE